jgi:hypothetical protein
MDSPYSSWMSDSDAVGPDGTVRLRRYLPLADSHWFSAGCEGPDGCGHTTPISITAAICLMRSGDATVGQLAQHLRCGRCSKRQVGIVLRSDSRPAWVREREGPAPETQADPRHQSSGTAQHRR